MNLLHSLIFLLKSEELFTQQTENLKGKIRKYTRNKLSFPTDDAVKKSMFLAFGEVTKKWTMPIHNWGVILNQFMTIFENRVQLNKNQNL